MPAVVRSESPLARHAAPSCSPQGIVENPFCKADYHGEHNVRPLEETEEWLERHGHWASPRLHKLFDTEIELREVRPEVVRLTRLA